MRLALLAITAAVLHAQSPEIRGTVTEQGSGAGLPGVEVTLTLSSRESPRVVATTFTNASGNFAFKPEAFGQYQINLKKTGYAAPGGIFAYDTSFISAEFPLWQPRLTLMNPGTVTGRVLDEQDRPVAGLRVVFTAAQSPGLGSQAMTAADGAFTATGVAPGSYLIRVLPLTPDSPKIEEYTDEAFERIDRGYEDLVWPSGVPDPRDAVPLVVTPGGAATLGTIHLRQVERYRVRLNVQGDCTADIWTLALIKAPNAIERLAPLRCKQQLLLTNVPSGSYEIALWSDGDDIGWAIAPLIVNRSNTALSLTLSKPTDVPGRITTSQGVPPPRITGTGFLLMMHPDVAGLSTSDQQEPQVQLDGTFVAHQLRWNRYRVSAPRIPAPYYVREIRYNGRPASDGRIELLPGAALEFELDNQPAHISGTVTNGGQPFTGRAYVLLAKAPYDVPTFVEGNAPFSYIVPAVDGRFDLSGLAPGEYRIAVSTDSAQLPQLIPSGEKITLERGQQRTVSLKLPSPPR